MTTSDLDRYLAELPDRLREELADVIREEAEALSDAQREALRAQLQPPDDSGALEESCVVVDGANELEVIVQAGGEATTTEIRDSSGVPYDHALAFEYGNSRQPPRPFFWTTVRARRDAMQERITAAIEKVLK
jgi:hypothetical protein